MYIPKEWVPREGTNLNKFTKSGETATSVILTNAPDAITQAGTPFAAAAMNNIEAGIQETRGGPFPSPSEFTTGLATLYGLAYDGTALYVTEWDTGKVKKINLSTGVAADFTTGLTTPYDLAYDGTALYVAELNTGKVKKINLSTGAAAEFTTGLTYPRGLAYDGTALYVTEEDTGKVKKINLSTGVASEFTTGLTTPQGLTYDGTALYVAELNTGKVKKINLSTGAAAEFTTGLTYPRGLAYDGTALYVTEEDTGKVKKINLSTGVASEFTTGLTTPHSLTYDGTALYVTEWDSGKVKKMPTFPEFIAPSSILLQSITSANVTMTEDRFGNILLSGVLTGNRELILPSAVRTYKIINNCTGARYVHVKTASGAGVYMAPGDIWDVYCDGTNIKPIGLVSSTREITVPTITFSMGTASAQVPLSSVTPTSDALSEIGSNVFTAKNKGIYQVRCYAIPTASLTAIVMSIYKNGSQLVNGGRDTVNTASTEVRAAISSAVPVNAGDTLSLYIMTNTADSAMKALQITITQIA